MKRSFIFGLTLMCIFSMEGSISIRAETTNEPNSDVAVTSEQNTTETEITDVGGDTSKKEDTIENVTKDTIAADKNKTKKRIIYALNNLYKDIDYKLDDESIQRYNSLVADGSEWIVSGAYDDSQNLDSVSTEESWLLSNNVLSRRVTVSANGCSTFSQDTDVRLSDFWMMLYKAKNGVIESRPVVYNKNEEYYYYVSPNVYELYFKELLDKGLLSKDSFNSKDGKAFIKDYESISSKNYHDAGVFWVSGLGYAKYTSKEKNPLGYSTTIDSKKFKCIEQQPNYFKDEELLTLDALKCIESFMRLSEKEMTKLEASIVSYKYGISFLSKLSESDKETVQFLVAKGILNFEDPNEMINLYGPLTRELAYKLVYRVANVDARFTFSEIQLTDNDTAWQSKGYGEDRISITNIDHAMYNETVTDSELKELLQYQPKQNTDDSSPDTDDYDYSVDEILGFGKLINVQAKTKLYKVIKVLDSNYNYMYSGIPISRFVSDNTSWTQEIEGAKQDNIKTISGEDLSVNIITFRIQAKNYSTAVMYVDNNITLDNDLNVTQVIGYTTVSDGNEEITLISEDTIRDSLPNIAIIEDKVLTNTVTGSQAVLLVDTGYALVGNQIIVSDVLLETDINGKVYYNLDIICYLLSNAQLRNITAKEIYVVNNVESEMTLDFYSSLGVKLGRADALRKDDKIYYNASNLSGISKLIRKFVVVDGEESIPVYFILNLSYVVPSLESFESNQIDSFSDSNNSLAKMSDLFYTKPTSASLSDWWDSNYGMTNSLCNFMYGTKGVEYVKSGYVTSSLVILRTKAIKDNTISSIFSNNGFKPDATTKKYCNETTKWWKNYYGDCMSTDYLNALARQSRTITFYDGVKSGNGMSYDSKYYVTGSGIVYESIDADERITYKDKKLRITTRTVGQTPINEDTTFSYGGNEWIYLGTTVDGTKYKIIPNFAVSYFNSISVASSAGEFYVSDSNLSTDDCWEKTVETMDKLYQKYFDTKMSCSTQMVWTSHPPAKDLFGYSKSIKDKDFYYVLEDSIVDASGEVKAKANGNSIEKEIGSYGNFDANEIDMINGKRLRICPIFYLDVHKYSFYSVSGSFRMVGGDIAKTLNLNNIFTVGISRSVSDSIIAKYTNTVELNSLLQGQRVMIGDVIYTCRNDSSGSVCFVSDPIVDITFASSIVDCALSNNKDAIKSKIIAMFLGQKVYYGGLSYNLSSFIEEAQVGDRLVNEADKLLYRSGKSYYIYSNGSSYSDLTRSCDSVVVQLKFSDGLLVMPLTSKQADYVLINRSTISGDTKLDDIPFYGENLSYTSEGDYDLTLGKSKYRISQFYRETKGNFRKMMKEAFEGDLINFIWAIIFSFASYITIIIWVLFVVLHYGIGLRILQIISLPVGKDRIFHKGFDVVKLLSFGIYNLDSDPTLARTVITSFCSFIVAFAIVVWIPH